MKTLPRPWSPLHHRVTMNEWARAIRLAGDIVRHTLNALMTNEWTLFLPHTHHRLFFASSHLCTERVLAARCKESYGRERFHFTRAGTLSSVFKSWTEEDRTSALFIPFSFDRPPGFVRIALVKFVSSHAPKGFIAIACLGPNFCVAAFPFSFRIMDSINEQNSHH